MAACVTNRLGLIIRANTIFFSNIAKAERIIDCFLLEDLIHASDRDKLSLGVHQVKDSKARVAIGRCRTLTFEGDNEFPIFRQYDWVLSPGIETDTVIASGRIVSAKERIANEVETEAVRYIAFKSLMFSENNQIIS